MDIIVKLHRTRANVRRCPKLKPKQTIYLLSDKWNNTKITVILFFGWHAPRTSHLYSYPCCAQTGDLDLQRLNAKCSHWSLLLTRRASHIRAWKVSTWHVMWTAVTLLICAFHPRFHGHELQHECHIQIFRLLLWGLKRQLDFQLTVIFPALLHSHCASQLEWLYSHFLF